MDVQFSNVAPKEYQWGAIRHALAELEARPIRRPIYIPKGTDIWVVVQNRGNLDGIDFFPSSLESVDDWKCESSQAYWYPNSGDIVYVKLPVEVEYVAPPNPVVWTAVGFFCRTKDVHII